MYFGPVSLDYFYVFKMILNLKKKYDHGVLQPPFMEFLTANFSPYLSQTQLTWNYCNTIAVLLYNDCSSIKL